MLTSPTHLASGDRRRSARAEERERERERDLFFPTTFFFLLIKAAFSVLASPVFGVGGKEKEVVCTAEKSVAL
jgi:hypothetical protein